MGVRGGANRPWRRAHLPELDRRVREMTDNGMSVREICLELGVGKTCVAQSRARTRPVEEMEADDRFTEEKLAEFERWLFDSRNAAMDPCIKWIELFGTEET